MVLQWLFLRDPFVPEGVRFSPRFSLCGGCSYLVGYISILRSRSAITTKLWSQLLATTHTTKKADCWLLFTDYNTIINHSYYQTVVLNNCRPYLLLHVTLQRTSAVSAAGCCPGPPRIPQVNSLEVTWVDRRSVAAHARGR